MAPYHIRQYQERDHKRVLELFSRGMEEHIPATFRHMLTLPQTLLPLLGVLVTIVLVSGSWLLATVCSFLVLLGQWLLVWLFCRKYVAACLHTDLADITKSYLNARGSFWVAESGGQVVGMVGCLPVKDPPLGRKQLQLFRLSVSSQHRGQGIAKALVRTVLQFARDQGYSDVVLETSIVQYSALGLYQAMGFQKTGTLLLETQSQNSTWTSRPQALPFLYTGQQLKGSKFAGSIKHATLMATGILLLFYFPRHRQLSSSATALQLREKDGQ